MYKRSKYILYINNKKMASEANQASADVIYSIQKGSWQHVAVTISIENKTATVYHNCQPVLVFAPQTISLKKTSKSQLLFAPEFSGLLTEIRVWKSCRSLDQLRSNKSTPLSIVNEMTAAVVLIDLNKLDKRSKLQNTSTEDSKDKKSAGFDLGLKETPTTTTNHESGWDFSQPKDYTSASSRKSSSKIEKIGTPNSGTKIAAKKSGKKSAGFDLPLPKEAASKSDWGISLPPADQPKVSDPHPQKSAETTTAVNKPSNDSVNASQLPVDEGKIFADKHFLQEYQQPLTNKYAISFEELFSLDFATSDKFATNLSASLQLCVSQTRALYLQDKFEEALELLDTPFQNVKQLMLASQQSENPLPEVTIQKLSSSFSKLIPYKLFVFSVQHLQPAILPHVLTLETSPTDKTLLSVAMVLQLFRSKTHPTIAMQLLSFIQQLNKKDRLSERQRRECAQAAAWAAREPPGPGLGAGWNKSSAGRFTDPTVGFCSLRPLLVLTGPELLCVTFVVLCS